MAYYHSDWDDLGDAIRDIVDRAVNSRNFQQLNQTIRQAVDTGTETLRQAVDTGTEAVRRTVTAQPKPQLPRLYGSTHSVTTGGVLKIVGGSLLGGFTLLGMLAMGALNFLWYGFHMSLPWPVVLLGLGGGGGLIASGIGNLRMVKRFKAYCRLLGEKTSCSLEKLASGVGKSTGFVRRELEKMIAGGLFLQGHLNREGTQLITSHETYQYFEQSRIQLEQRRQAQAARERAEAKRSAKAAGDARVQEVLDRGNGFIRDIRACNDRIPGEAVSAKIDRMESIVRQIFRRAEADPEVIPDLKKLMDYYLPMTVKLLNAYADMDEQGVQGATIDASKREIEDTLDTLNLAFEKLLDDLFRDTALDVSSDISVLHTLLAQEGLKDDALAKMQKK